MLALATTAVVFIGAGCSNGDSGDAASAPTRLTVRVVAAYPHDSTSFTQGFEIDDGRLIEGTGLVGRSRVTATDLVSGAVLADAELPEPFFGEGLTVATGATPPVLWQLTWQNGTAIKRDPATLAELGRVDYDKEGWGICDLGDGRVITSDGTSTLTFRDPNTLAALDSVEVRRVDKPVTQLNELECTPDGVYANVWQTNFIVRIDPSTGDVTAVIDASTLQSQLGPDGAGADVLNGIAAIPDSPNLLLTGKLWPTMFEVALEPARG